MQFQLHPYHPTSHEIKGEIALDDAKKILSITYLFLGDTHELLVPPLSLNPQYKEELWKNTCFEFFFYLNSQEYIECNFSPSKDYWSMHFLDYRIAASAHHPIIPLGISHIQSLNSFKLEVKIPFKYQLSSKPLQIAAVTEDPKTKKLNFWALNQGYSPDFHRKDNFQVLF